MVFTIVGLVALSFVATYAQDVPTRMVRIKSFSDATRPELCLAESVAGDLEWAENPYASYSVWFEIPVAGSDDGDVYIQNAVTGKYLYRETTGKTIPDGDWVWEKAALGETNEETDFYKFRWVQGQWEWSWRLVSVADADFDAVTAKGAFFLAAIQYNHNAGWPALPAVVMTTMPGEGNAWTATRVDEVTELIKRKVRIENFNSALQYLIESEEGNLEWGNMDKAHRDLSAWFEIPVESGNPNSDFYLKNASSGKYIYREGTKTIPTGDWDRDNGLLAEENGETDAFVFRFVNSTETPVGGSWGGRGWLVNMLDAQEDNADRPFPSKGSALCIHGGTGAQDGSPSDWFPSAKIAAIGDGSNVWTSVKMDIASEIMYYSVTFNRKNGSANEKQAVAEDDMVTKPADPTRLNYAFLGWSLDDQGEDDGEDEFIGYDFETAVTEEFTLFAWWKYDPQEIEEVADKIVRIRGNQNTNYMSQYEPWTTRYFVRENPETGMPEWSGITDDFASWSVKQIAGTRDFYYVNLATGKYLYRSHERNVETTSPGGSPVGDWRYEVVLLGEDLPEDADEEAYYRWRDYFWKPSSGTERQMLLNMGGVTVEDPDPNIVKNGALVLCPMNANHGTGGAPLFPAVVAITTDPGNDWSQVYINPPATPMRIQAWSEGDKDQFLTLQVTKAPDPADASKEIDVYTVEWSDEQNDNSMWFEMAVNGTSETDVYYQNGQTRRYLYREDTGKTLGSCDWLWEYAKASEKYDGTDYYHFRKLATPDWGGRVWLVNVADANFTAVNNKGAFVLSGIQGENTACDAPALPAAIMGSMPGAGNVWTSVKVIEAVETVFHGVFFVEDLGVQKRISVADGETIDEDEIYVPVKAGYTFLGWYEDENFSKVFDFNTAIVELTYIYAKWEMIPVDPCAPIRVVRIYDHSANEVRNVHGVEIDCSIKGWLRASMNGAIAWSAAEDEDCNWYEIPVEGASAPEFYYVNSYGYYLYRDNSNDKPVYEEREVVDPETGEVTKEQVEVGRQPIVLDGNNGDWEWQAVLTDKDLPSKNDEAEFFRWRLIKSNWNDGNNQGFWMANVAGSNFNTPVKEKQIWVLSGINKFQGTAAASMAYPDNVVTQTQPNDNNVWTGIYVKVMDDNFTNPFVDICLCNPNAPGCGGGGTSGAPETDAWPDMNVYPNPTRDMMSIDGLKGGELITIYDLSGRIIFTAKATAVKENLSVNALPVGTYILKVSNGYTEKSIKFVVMQ